MIFYKKNAIYKTGDGNVVELLLAINNAIPIVKDLKSGEVSICKGDLFYLVDDYQSFLEKASFLIDEDEPDASRWSFVRWKAEVSVIAKTVADLIEEYVEEEDLHWEDDAEDIEKQIVKFAYDEIRESRWFTSAKAKERAMNFSWSQLDASSADIYKFVIEENRHKWEAVRDATFYAYITMDIKKTVLTKLEERLQED